MRLAFLRPLLVWSGHVESISDNIVYSAKTRCVSLRYYTVDPILLPSGNPIECREEVLSLPPIIQARRFDIFLP